MLSCRRRAHAPEYTQQEAKPLVSARLYARLPNGSNGLSHAPSLASHSVRSRGSRRATGHPPGHPSQPRKRSSVAQQSKPRHDGPLGLPHGISPAVRLGTADDRQFVFEPRARRCQTLAKQKIPTPEPRTAHHRGFDTAVLSWVPLAGTICTFPPTTHDFLSSEHRSVIISIKCPNHASHI